MTPHLLHAQGAMSALGKHQRIGLNSIPRVSQIPLKGEEALALLSHFRASELILRPARQAHGPRTPHGAGRRKTHAPRSGAAQLATSAQAQNSTATRTGFESCSRISENFPPPGCLEDESM